MRFLVDAQLPPALCGWLRTRGHEADHVADALAGSAADAEVAAHAAGIGAILITKDSDFVDRPVACRVLWVRLGNATTRVLLPWLDARWPECERLLEQGETLIELA